MPTGLVVATHGRHVVVEAPDGQRLICHPRGKKNLAVVGDRVRWQRSHDEGTVEAVEPRSNLFFRQDELRTKSFAANLGQVLVLIAAEPEFSEVQLARALVAAEAAGITPVIALNKRDLAEPFARASARLAPYRAMGYPVLHLALRQALDDDRAALLAHLAGKTTLVLGPSGAGKSTLINLLVPGALAATGELSRALGAGRHTTTHTALYWVDRAAGTALIDSPGFQAFGLAHVTPARLASLMPDFRPHLGHCRFANCSHLHEPGCAVISSIESASKADSICLSRYDIYSLLYQELSAPTRW